MGHTEVVPATSFALQAPFNTTNKQDYARCIRNMKILSCAVVVLTALCLTIIGILSWHITQTVVRQNQENSQKEQELIQAKFGSQEAWIRSLQTDMQRDRWEMNLKISDQGNAIAMNADKIEKANETIISIGTEDIRNLRADIAGFAEDLINLHEMSNAKFNIVQQIQEDFGVHTDSITSLLNVSKTFSDKVESLLEEFKRYRDDIELKTLYKNLTEEKYGDDIEEMETMYKNLTEIQPRDCADFSTINESAQSGILRIYPTSNLSIFGVSVYCDMVTRGGGWIVIQRRQDGSEDFYRNWQEYKEGFGNLNSEFWLGLDKIHALVSDGVWKLLINMRDDVKGEKYAMYETFSIGPESEGYVLTVGAFAGNAGDSLTSYHNAMKFSTKDQDNDSSNRNCAAVYTGAWWYSDCQLSNLNGAYGSTGNQGPRWLTVSGSQPIEFVEMKIKRKM